MCININLSTVRATLSLLLASFISFGCSVDPEPENLEGKWGRVVVFNANTLGEQVSFRFKDSTFGSSRKYAATNGERFIPAGEYRFSILDSLGDTLAITAPLMVRDWRSTYVIYTGDERQSETFVNSTAIPEHGGIRFIHASRASSKLRFMIYSSGQGHEIASLDYLSASNSHFAWTPDHDSLVVIDANNRSLGMLDLRDLPSISMPYMLIAYGIPGNSLRPFSLALIEEKRFS